MYLTGNSKLSERADSRDLLNKSLPSRWLQRLFGKTYSPELTRLTFIPTFVCPDPVPSWPPWDGKDGAFQGNGTRTHGLHRSYEFSWQTLDRLRWISASGTDVCITDRKSKTPPKEESGLGPPCGSKSIPSQTYSSSWPLQAKEMRTVKAEWVLEQWPQV